MILTQVTMLITMLNSNGYLFQHRAAMLFQQCWMMLNDIDSSYNVIYNTEFHWLHLSTSYNNVVSTVLNDV